MINMKILFVGDPHVQRSNLDESERLMEWIRITAKKNNAKVLFAGDLYNDFAVKRVEVEEFWDKHLRSMDNPVVITGNHDMNSDATASALTVHKSICEIIDSPKMASFGDFAFMPFIRDNALFIRECLKLHSLGAKLIFCHAEFNGAQYENGFYSPHGIDPKELPTDLRFISGHIHKEQEFGNVWYPGTPRQLTRSDVGEVKGIHLLTIENNVLSKKEFIATPEEVCTPFRQITITPETVSIPVIPISDRVYVDIQGPKDFISAVLKSIPNQAKIRTFPDQDARIDKISETDGIPIAFMKYAEKFSEEKKLPEEIKNKVIQKVYSHCASLKMETV